MQSQDKAGNKLTIGGEFQFVAPTGKPALSKTQFSLDATYQMEGSKLVFAADFQKNGDRPSYNLCLDGKYELRNGEVTFSVKLQNTAAGQELKVSLGSVFANEKLKAHLEAVVSKTPSGQVDFSLNLDIRVRWVNGERVQIEKPQPV